MTGFSEIQRRIQLLEQAVAEREKRLNAFRRAYEGGGNPSAYTESVLVENELKILRRELEKKRAEAEEAKRELEARLPELEKRYLEKIPTQQKLLGEIEKKARELLQLISRLSENINEIQKDFAPYSNVCDQLHVAKKSLHLLDLPNSLTQARRWLRIFLEWVEGREHGR